MQPESIADWVEDAAHAKLGGGVVPLDGQYKAASFRRYLHVTRCHCIGLSEAWPLRHK